MDRFHCLREARCQCYVCIYVTKPTARSFIGPVATVRGAVTKEVSANANNRGLFPAGKLPRVAQLLREADPGKSFPGHGFLVAVVDKLAPVATLLLHVKGKTRRTPDSLQALTRKKISKVDEWMIGCLNEPYRICALHNISAVVLPSLQPEKFLVAFVRAECLLVVFQFLFLAQDAWGTEIMHLHINVFLVLVKCKY